MYQYVNLTGGLIVSLFLKLCLNVDVLHIRTLMTWYPLTNFLSKGFLVKFLTKTCVPTLYFGNVLAYLSLFLAQWILIHLSSSAWVFQISLHCCKHFNPQFVPVYLCSSSSSFSSASMGSLP